MSNIIDKIEEQNRKIERDIDRIGIFEDGEVCSNVIEKLRTLIEHIFMLHYMKTNSISEDIVYQNIEAAKSYVYQDKHLEFLTKQHKFLQAYASHYVIDEVTAPRLIQKYSPYLFKIKEWLQCKYNVQILNNLEKIARIGNSQLSDYYGPISKLIPHYDYIHNPSSRERYYVDSCYPILVTNRIIYEVTLGIASDYASKFNKFIVFSDEEIPTNYSIKCELIEKEVLISSLITKIQIIQDWAISIRPCEFENYGSIFGISEKVLSNSNEYIKLMAYINNTKETILDIIVSDNYQKIKKDVLSNTEEPHIFNILDSARKHAFGWYSERNLIKYLAYNLNNRIIKDQRNLFKANNVGLFVSPKIYPFCNLPFVMSLHNHNPSITDLIEVFGEPNDYELVYRKIRTTTESDNILYHRLDELFSDSIEEIKTKIDKINKELSWNESSQIMHTGENYYIKEYEDSTIYILTELIRLSKNGITGYSNYVSSIISNNHIVIESDEKRKILLNLFSNTCVACIFGAAGTGKSFLAKLISLLYSDSKKTYISTTNTAVNNLYHKVGGNMNDFMTINQYLKSSFSSDILFIDECSMVSNQDMEAILEKSGFKCLVLLGDIVQIESIKFGNWYKLAKTFLTKNAKNELCTMFRTSSKELQLLWEKVRNKEDVVSELLSQYGMIKEIYDESLFEYQDNQIVLSLNYNGLYGINNLNSIMQGKNKNNIIRIGSYIYKVNDPIIFTENNQFYHVLYNNLKGKILSAEEKPDSVSISILVETVIDAMSLSDYPEIELVEVKDNKSVILLTLDKDFDSDKDESKSKLPPFQVAYAVSIHKSQGLEFENVKIVISNDIDDEISHNIFYTAITRSSKNISIYWTSETQDKILKKINEGSTMRDIGIISTKFGFKIRN